VGALLSEEVRRKSSIETSTPEAMVVRGDPEKEGRNREVHPDPSQRERRVS
jgi:hypothetical protein